MPFPKLLTIGIDASRPNERQKTGTEWYAYHIIQQLKIIDRQNKYRLYSIDTLRDGLEDMPANFEGRILRSPTEMLWTQFRLSIEMATKTPDVLFVPAHTIPLIHPKVTVLTVHDLGFEYFPELYKQTPIGPSSLRGFITVAARIATLGEYGNSEYDYHRWAMRFGVKHATRIIAISEFTKNDIITRFGADPKRISVIPHAYDPALYYPPAPGERPKSALIKRFFPYFLFVGRIEKKKNISTLLTAYESFRARHKTGPKLILIGKPGLGFEEYRLQVARFAAHIRQDVHFLGWLPEEETAEFYRFAHGFLFPTNFEGFGIGVIQAMASGVPVVTSNVTSLPEVTGGAAILINPNDHRVLEEAMADIMVPSSRQSLIAKGVRRAKDFSWKKSAEQTLAVLQQAYCDVPRKTKR